MGNGGALIYIEGLDIEGKKVIYDVEAASECFLTIMLRVKVMVEIM